MTITCGIDWAESHHDVALVDGAGKLVAQRRISDDAEGFRRLLELLTEAGDTAGDPIPVAVETARGLLIACLRTTGRTVYSINPMAVARYRERHRVTDADMHRPLPTDSELVQAIAVLARAQQDAAWNRGQLSNQLRSHLKQYFPAALAAFQVRGIGLDSREARAVLAVAADPATAAKLTTTRLHTVLRKSGRQRAIDAWAKRLRSIFSAEHLHQPPLLEAAMGRHTQALVAQLEAACRAADDRAEATAEAFDQHPDAQIPTSFPGIGPVTGARVLGEIGDDRARVPRRPGAEVLRRLRTDHHRLRQEPRGAPSQGQESTARRSRLRLDLRGTPPHRRSNATMTCVAPPGTSTLRRWATCSTASSAASTTACRPGRPSIPPRPSPSRPRGTVRQTV